MEVFVRRPRRIHPPESFGSPRARTCRRRGSDRRPPRSRRSHRRRHQLGAAHPWQSREPGRPGCRLRLCLSQRLKFAEQLFAAVLRRFAGDQAGPLAQSVATTLRSVVSILLTAVARRSHQGFRTLSGSSLVPRHPALSIGPLRRRRVASSWCSSCSTARARTAASS